MADRAQLEGSYANCRGVARSAARNFYFAFFLLPRAKRDALCALYAFMRRADDISDSAGGAREREGRLAAWRLALDRALAGDFRDDPALPALHHTVEQYAIPSRYLHDLISGTQMDLRIASYATFDDLRKYCYHVAGTVGLCCLHVFGFRDPRAPELAENLGLAFQLTNILRDVPQDFAMRRVYLPQEDFERFGYGREALSAHRLTPEFRELMRFEAQRTWGFYRQGAELLSLISADSRAALWALIHIYSGILREIEARDYDVFSPPPPGLSTAQKLWSLTRARLGLWSIEYDFEERGGRGRRAGGTLLRRRAG